MNIEALPDARLTFLLGGARSGKSAHAESLIMKHQAPWTYIATAEAHDSEMAERISEHQARRDDRWQTVDAPIKLNEALTAVPDGQAVLVDCLTLWLTNLMLGDHDIEVACDELLRTLAKPRGPWFIVSNETGLGIVPDNALARRFRDEAGRLNQRVAACANDVSFMVAGLAMKVK